MLTKRKYLLIYHTIEYWYSARLVQVCLLFQGTSYSQLGVITTSGTPSAHAREGYSSHFACRSVGQLEISKTAGFYPLKRILS